MPPPKTGPGFTKEQADLLEQWINQGAKYDIHWSFKQPVKHAIPVDQTNWASQPLDGFIVAALRAKSLKPSAMADKYTLIRRLSLDLRGLPPTLQEVNDFVRDEAPNAYEKLVDRYLADKAFGEKWARQWLDLARYADSAGYGSDPLRLNIWPYRDWVIDAFNRNQPYDQFTREQLAGDLLPNPTPAQIVATAFHRNTMTNTEGGTDDEEFRVAAVKDRVDTTGQVWLGLTVGCAKCHSHKFDPVSMNEYYQLYAIFNQTADFDQPNETPTYPVETWHDRENNRVIDGKIKLLEAQLNTDSQALQTEYRAWLKLFAEPLSWQTLRPHKLASKQASVSLTQASDGTIQATGENPEQATYVVQTSFPVGNFSLLKLDVVPAPRSASPGPGRASHGNFVLSQIKIETRPKHVNQSDSKVASKPARFVRITLPGKQKILSLAEVQVYSDANEPAQANRKAKGTQRKNLALGAKATQSSTDFEGLPERAVDGNTNGKYFEGNSVTHCKQTDDPWWEVDLGTSKTIDEIVIWGRTDPTTEDRLSDYQLTLLDAERKVVQQTTIKNPPKPSHRWRADQWEVVGIANASASFEQSGFPIADAIRAKASNDKGWAISPELGKAHFALFQLTRPIDGKSEDVRITLACTSKFERHTLGQFLLSVTSAGNSFTRVQTPPSLAALASKPTRSAAEETQLLNYFRTIAQVTQATRQQIAALQASRPPKTQVPVMQELTGDKKRSTHILVKGNWSQKGDAIGPGLPAFAGFGAPSEKIDRLALAEFVVDRRNPLTARVAVNRLWAGIFGIGIVETEEDFGTQGDLPTHPELLDWLAIDFMEHGWDIKRMIKQIVLSSTYRQTSTSRADLAEKDPRNRLYGRASRPRLDAETIRDQALAFSGLLDRKIGGPSVYPYQPPGLWQAAFNGERTWTTSQGTEKYRRGIYTFWRRTIPYPSMTTFDAPSREFCTVRRIATNTPLQAFVTLNDPAFVEAAQALGRRLVREGGETTESRLAYGLNLVRSRPASPTQIQALSKLFASEVARYQDKPTDARKLATEPLGSYPTGWKLSDAESAAWTAVGNVLLNLDQVLTKG